MRKRTISALIAIGITFPLIFLGGNIFKFMIIIIGLIGLYEFMDIKEEKDKLSFVAPLIGSISFVVIIISNANVENFVFTLDYRTIIGVFLLVLLPLVIYHNNKKYNIKDALYLMGKVILLSIPFSLFILIRNYNLSYIFLVMLMAFGTDIFAYTIGMLIGRHKLLESISPKKSWEGLIGGVIMGVFLSTMYYLTIINSNANLLRLILIFFSYA